MDNFDATTKFKKEFKQLSKKYKTLDDDIKKFKRILTIQPTGIGKNFVIIHSLPDIKIIKARLACRTLRNRSLRIIYSYLEQKQQIDFIELYFKGNKKNENQDRIKEYLKNI